MLKEIYDRQSVRRFQAREVEKEKIEELLHAAMQAPTARNTQSWRFLVITNREALDTMKELQPYTGMMQEAACAILVMGDRSANDKDGYLYVDAAAAIENMLLEAVHQGLGACWCAVAPLQERIDNFRRYYHIEEQYLPIGVVAIGYPKEQRPFMDCYDPKKVSWWQ